MININKISQAAPLLGLICIIALLTCFIQWCRHHSNAQSMCADFMGLFFIIFGALKLIRYDAFVESFSNYDLIAGNLPAYAKIYPFIELGLGLAYMLRIALPVTNFIAFIVMGIGAIGILKALLAGQDLECACMGTFFNIPLGWLSFAENSLMSIMALIMLLLSRL